MYTELKKIAEHGLSGNTEYVEKYLRLFVSKYCKENTSYSDPFEQRLAKGFKDLLEGNTGEGEVTLDYCNCPTCCHTGIMPHMDCPTCEGSGQFFNKDQRFIFPDAETTLKLKENS